MKMDAKTLEAMAGRRPRIITPEPVGDILVYGTTIIEPLTNATIARGFPSHEAAVLAATQMNEVADWVGVLKARAQDRNPNCVEELADIAKAWGGELSRSQGVGFPEKCAAIVARLEVEAP